MKAEHQRFDGTLRPLPIPKWKWDEIAIDLFWGYPRHPLGKIPFGLLSVVLQRVSNFISIKVKDPMDKLAKLYVQNIVCLHGLPSTIISDRDSCFTSRFWQSLQKEMGTELKFSTVFHPQIDGQSERTN